MSVPADQMMTASQAASFFAAIGIGCLVALLVANGATGESALHKPGARPGSGLWGWFHPDDR